jgi:glutaredoxin
MPEPRITLYSKPGCHLCDTAREAVARIAEETGAGWTDINIVGDPALEDAYAEMIPVILLDGRMHGYYRVEEDRLRRDLAHGSGA